ncbi:MAG TPA: Vms1/Ankzf1 family peptidyl-tRNA hydrolase [Vicinamibacterales bacterium]|jgi:peptide chain release factor subunit 1
MPTTDTLAAQLDRVAAFDSGPFPVVSLYLNLQPDQHGRDNFEPFLRKALAERLRTYGAEGPERKSLEQDAEKIRTYVNELDAAVNGLALFACSGAELFEAIAVAAPIPEHKLYISEQPHLYPLARLLDDFPRYAVVLADTHLARIFVVAGNRVVQTEQVEGTKTRRHRMGGWSQARYQRHIDNFHAQHAKEVVDTLARIVTDEAIPSIVVAGDEVIVPLLRDYMPKELTARIIDTVKLDIRAPEHEVLEATRAAMQEKDAQTDRERVDALIGAYRGNGLAVAGIEDTRAALELGQVDELLVTGAPAAIEVHAKAATTTAGERSPGEQAADELIAKARQTAATVRIVQDAALLSAVGGVGAFLRFKL